MGVFFTWPLASNLSGQHVVHIDPPFSAWRLARVAHQLTTDPSRLFEGDVFWPALQTLAYSDAMLLTAILAWPLLAAGVPPMAVTNLFTIAGMVVSAYAAFLLAWRLCGHPGAAVMAGIVFAFSPYRRAHVAHLELQWAQWMPLACWAWHRALDRGTFRDGLLCACFVLAQLFSSIYYGLFLGLLLGLVGLVTLAARRWLIAPRTLLGLGLGVLATAAATFMYAQPYERVQRRVGERSVQETAKYSAQPASYLAVPPDNVVYGPLTGDQGGEETKLFPGATALALAAVAVVPPVSAAVVAYGVAGVVAAELSLGMNGRLFPVLRTVAPPFRGLRAAGRFAIVVQLALGILAAIGLTRVMRRWPGWGPLAIAGACALAMVEYANWPLRVQQVPATAPPVYRWLASEPPQVTLELPVPAPLQLPLHDPFYMYAATWHWQPLVNGYSGHYARHYLLLLEVVPQLPSEQSLAHLDRLGVQRLVIHRGLYRRREYLELIAALDRHPMFHLVTTTEDHIDEVRVYAYLPGFGPR
jgi:hypothetical protein